MAHLGQLDFGKSLGEREQGEAVHRQPIEFGFGQATLHEVRQLNKNSDAQPKGNMANFPDANSLLPAKDTAQSAGAKSAPENMAASQSTFNYPNQRTHVYVPSDKDAMVGGDCGDVQIKSNGQHGQIISVSPGSDCVVRTVPHSPNTRPGD